MSTPDASGLLRDRVPPLDGVRGLAVVFVMCSHLANENITLIDGLKFAGSGSGQIGVFLFFALSAFLLTRRLIHAGPAALRTTGLWVDYVRRRVLRIYPLFVTVMLFVVVAAAAWPASPIVRRFQGFRVSDLGAHLVLQQGRAHFWTIPTEEKYYLLLPIVAVTMMLAFKGRPLLVAAAVLAASAASTVYTVAYPPAISFSLLKFLPMFLAGSACAFIHARLERRPHRGGRAWTAAAVTMCAALLAAMPNTWQMLGGEAYQPDGARLALPWGILLGAFLIVIANERGPVAAFFSSRVMRFLGLVSFSAYLWHLFVLEWVVTLGGMPNPARVLLFFALSLAVSTGSFLTIERPMARLANRWGARAPRPAPPAGRPAAAV